MDAAPIIQGVMMTELFRQGMSVALPPGLDMRWPKNPFLMKDKSSHTTQYVGAFDPFSTLPPTTVTPPVQMILIQYCEPQRVRYCELEHIHINLEITSDIQRLAPWFSYLEDEQHPWAPGLAWMPDAVQHPVLFHATMLCSAVHLQRIQPMKLGNSQIALWIKTETIRLLNESLSSLQEGPSDEIMMSTLILLYWNVSLDPVFIILEF
jgi:hypothetical protein